MPVSQRSKIPFYAKPLMQRKQVRSKPREFDGLVTPWTDLSYTQGNVRRNRKKEDRGRSGGRSRNRRKKGRIREGG